MTDEAALVGAGPPWTLRGAGLVAVFGARGVLMLVRYASSPVGPYDELLWAEVRGSPVGLRPQVTRIVVSTEASVVWGRRNWGIPKELAAFQWSGAGLVGGPDGWGGEGGQVRVMGAGGEVLAHLGFRAGGPRVPVWTGVVPGAWRTLAQPDLTPDADAAGPRGTLLPTVLTTVQARGQVQAARLSVVQGAFHPALMDSQPLLTLAAPEFRMVFPVPRVVRADGRPA
ncbi:hypothetical protein M8445_00955 [Deinococcus aquaticus]|uniref:Acetoacetate decarboxylase n=1 Tax=Deinococcus aquaticus TaxID=328692 RepID=A0ABY7V0Y5_9DEIO|nr:hypothetical protein [Deinococcus aquaticus]WDA58818.1 hypothetical protein M8445_00955 [Deinococcus aquaticus]